MRCETVCVLLEDDFLPAYRATALRELVDRTAVEIPLVIINDESRRFRDRSIRYLLGRSRNWGAWLPVWAGTELSRAIRGPPSYDEPRHFSTVDALANANVVRCSPDRESEIWRSIPDPVVDRIADETDVVVRFGFGLLTGRILDAPDCGVLSFHFGDIRKYRGRIGPLWEYIGGEGSVGVTLQQLTDQIDGGRIVAIDHVPVHSHDTYGAIKRRQRTSVMSELLIDGLANLNSPEFEPTVPDSLGTYRSAPSVRETLAFLRKHGTNAIRRQLSTP